MRMTVPEVPTTGVRCFLLLGDGWDLKGTLTGLHGSQLAAVLNEIMEAERRRSCTCGRGCLLVPGRRSHQTAGSADALMALVAGATGPDGQVLAPNGSSRSRAVLIVRAED